MKKSTKKKPVNKKRKTNKSTATKYTGKKSSNKSKKRKNTKNKHKKNSNSYEGTIRLINVLLIILVFMILFLAGAIYFTSNEEAIIEKISSISSNSINYSVPKTVEEKQLWNILMEHFDDNETAVLGIMCNIKEESDFKANNLEELNNTNWDISDEDYTKKVNKGKISEDDFLESRYSGNTSGYYNSYGQWHNSNGGYGYCQYTAYEKKKALYNYATEWFSKDGEGKGKSFNIADPKMQSHFIVHLLNNELSDIDYKLRTAENIEDAVYIWLSEYEIPEGDYYEVTYQRAAYADEIREFCTAEDTGSSNDADMNSEFD